MFDVCHSDKDGSGAGDRIWKQPNIYPAEPWFVANPRAAGEDDGLLLIPVLDSKTKNAVNFANKPIFTQGENSPGFLEYYSDMTLDFDAVH
ncbi:beta-carotene 15, 15-dioxygenase 2, like [Plakobranchus ocellatus]|uniref:Beta-carotene 15, 15-dioxygenase 2, like n=1 Tax=Plakobranchus ocellatus TaxID=259542 RepID=A0AAV4A9V3_9GAST|nr:beta-carotene 15, 15-dioxygenase 2, like [Plakobranchus ocellatus]